MGFIEEPEVVKAEVSIVLFLISLALSAASALLIKRRKPENAVFLDDRPKTLATRGEHLPIVLGVERLGAIVAWVGNRNSTANNWLEDAMHLICLAPDTTISQSANNPKILLKRIMRDGKTLFQGRITPNSHPSGSVVGLASGESFQIYWGETNQPADPILNRQIFTGAKVQTSSIDKCRFPFVFRIIWLQLKLGPSPIWPQLDYVVEVHPQSQNLTLTKPWNDETFDFGPWNIRYLSATALTKVIKVFACSNSTHDTVAACERLAGSGGGGKTSFGRRLDIEPGSKIKIRGLTSGNGTYTVVSSTFFFNKSFLAFDVAIFINLIGINEIVVKESISSIAPISASAVFIDAQLQAQIGQDDGGPNPAHVIDQLTFARWPHGMSKSTARYDLSSLETVGTTLELRKDNDEALLGHVLMQGGITFSEVFTLMFQDLGLVLPLDPIAKRHVWDLIREPSGPFPHLPETMLLPPLPEIVTVHDSEEKSDHLVYVFRDQAHRHRNATIFIDEDGRARLGDIKHARKIDISIARDPVSAMKIATRRQYEDLSDGVVYKITASHAARLLKPGRPFTVFDIPDILRVVSVSPETLSSKCVIEALKDNFGVPVSLQSHVQGGGKGPTQTPTADIDFSPIEVNGFLTLTGQMTLWNPRIRGLNSIGAKTNIWIRHPTAPEASVILDNSLFSEIATTLGFQFGGGLVDAMTDSGLWEIVTGADVIMFGSDAISVQDLSADEQRWRHGAQIMLIDEEIMFLEGITDDSGSGDSRYILNGVIRARLGTVRAAHAIDAKIFIFPDTLEKIESDLYSVGSEARITTTPFSDRDFSGLDDLDSDTEQFVTLVGRGIGPLDPENLRTANLNDTYDANQDLVVKWDYRVRTGYKARTGAGMQGAGSATIIALPEGQFRLKFKNSGGVVKRTVVVTGTNTYTYTSAKIRADFSGEPLIIKFEVIAELNGLTSERTHEITIDKSLEVVDPPQTLTPEHDSTRLDFEDDWLYGSTIWTEATGTGGSITTIAGTANNPGIRKIANGGGAGGEAALTMDENLILLRNGIVFEAICSEGGTIGVTVNEIIWIGFVDSTIIGGGSVTNGVYFFWDSLTITWHAICISAIDGTTDINTNLNATGAFQKFRIEIAEVYSIALPTTAVPEARFYIDGVLVASIQTGIPVVTTEEVFPAFMVQDASGGTLALSVDSLFITAENLVR